MMWNIFSKSSFSIFLILLNIVVFIDHSKAGAIDDKQDQKAIDIQPFELVNQNLEQNQFLEPLSLETTKSNELFFSQSNPDDIQEDLGEPIDDDSLFWSVLFEQLEYRYNDNGVIFNWDVDAWVGGDYRKFKVKSEGEINLDESNGEGEWQFLYSKQISPFFDLQAGLRYDQLFGDIGKSRGHAVLGFEGLAPYFIEVEGALFVSQKGDVSARLEAEYEFLLSQKVILQPSIETNLAIQTVEDFGVGSGFNDVELGLRLRYEIGREFAPYIGISWERLLGETANLAKEEGESIDELKFLLGVRLLF